MSTGEAESSSDGDDSSDKKDKRVKKVAGWLQDHLNPRRGDERRRQGSLDNSEHLPDTLAEDRRNRRSSAPPGMSSMIGRAVLEKKSRAVSPDDVSTLRSQIGRHKFHGTGNPLRVRSPTTSSSLAVENLARIVKSGRVGREGKEQSGSVLAFKTERGNKGAFWAESVEVAGKYGWTGVIMPPDAKTDQPFPVEMVVWFLVEDVAERDQLKKLLETGTNRGEGVEIPREQPTGFDPRVSEVKCEECWEMVSDRVITVSQLADKLRGEGAISHLAAKLRGLVDR